MDQCAIRGHPARTQHANAGELDMVEDFDSFSGIPLRCALLCSVVLSLCSAILDGNYGEDQKE